MIIGGLMLAFGAYAETVTNNLNIQGGFIYNHGAINPGDVGMTFTNEGIRDVTVSVGQLSGVDPETGIVISNAANLLPLKAQSLTAVSNIVASGSFIGNGSGLTNLNVNSLSGSINASSLPTSGVWNASGVTITNAVMTGQTSIRSLTVTSNLAVNGTLVGTLNAGGNVISNAGSVYITGNANISNTVVAKQFRVSSSTIGSYSTSSTVLGGSGNTISNKVYNSAIVAGANNYMAGDYSFIGSGMENMALDNYTTVGGGRYNLATNRYAFVGGGRGNHSYGAYSSVSGGDENKAEADCVSIAGGYRNEVYAEKGSISGGGDNEIHAPYGFIGGGDNNRIEGTNLYAGILGGVNNSSEGYAAAIAGGEENIADGNYSFAAGRYAQALHDGSFVWSDSSTNVFQSVTNNEFAVYARGGLRLVGGRFVGDGGGLTNLTMGVSRESDPVWSSSSNLYYRKVESDALFASLTEYSSYTNATEWRLENINNAVSNLIAEATNTVIISTNIEWGNIAGTLSAQVDLADALANKLNTAGDIMSGTLSLQTNLLVQGQIIVGSSEFAAQIISNAVTGSLIVEGVIRGDGSGLTQLSATNLVGTISTNQLPPEALLFSGGVATNVLWGQISGTLSAQVDLSNALAGKLDATWTNTLELGTMAGAESNDYISVEQFTAETSNFADRSATTNIFSGELIAQTNLTVQGALTALYVPPQGDLLMGSFTNGLPQ